MCIRDRADTARALDSARTSDPIHRRHPAQALDPDHAPDPAVQRARHAGGPTDRASYACQCGYMFLAPVSTTVACPHCHAPQAW